MENNPLFSITDKAIGAFLGASCGDALGWPNERAGRSLSKTKARTSLISFQQWSRRSGGRFYPYEEIIKAGDYSDDTQLILCLSRSRLQGENWWQYWTQVELPFWTLYERGGGGATKRAADAWLDGRAPWSAQRNTSDIRRYFEAGGNGVAMRVLPHVVYGKDCDSFSAIASNIFIDGITTHGHPRALLGALAYGYALWKSIRRQAPLPYGALVDELITELHVWSNLPNLKGEFDSWLSSAKLNVQNYNSIWQETVIELKDALLLCQRELAKGALVFEEEVLEQLKCFDGKVSGSGTVAAVASVFLASRYAPDPINGVLKAAFAFGSDTDTIASMTGGLLGLVCGADWLSSLAQQVQDSKYLTRIAQQLLDLTEKGTAATGGNLSTQLQFRQFVDKVISEPEGIKLEMPGGRFATISEGAQHIGQSGKYRVDIKKLLFLDGQTIYLTRFSKGTNKQPEQKPLASQSSTSPKNIKSLGCGPKLLVDSFEESLCFYRDILGLSIKTQAKELVVFDQGLVLVLKHYAARLLGNIRLCSLLYVVVTDIEKRFALLQPRKSRIISQLSSFGKTKAVFFTCLDPDGNVVEVFSEKAQ